MSLIDATFKWIDENLKDSIDFVIWTGDSARHDNDVAIPRSVKQVTDSNILMVDKFVEVFGEKRESRKRNRYSSNDFIIPIVPTWGNNDILPHNIFAPGPNMWTRLYLKIWMKFIPEAQRHGFERGGWFFVEVIPGKLAVVSLNTLYFFDNNSAVDGCSDKWQPGYEHMEWLHVQLQFFRERGTKAIIIGHVPPARTVTKSSWDETCWQKYALWMHQFRDVVVGSTFGHMNIDHFMLQDIEDLQVLKSLGNRSLTAKATLNDELTLQSAANYLTELRSDWSRIPNPSRPECDESRETTNGGGDALANTAEYRIEEKRRSKNQEYLRRIGGKWAERYSLSLVVPSVVPNYFPSLRVFEYNVSNFEASASTALDQEVVGYENIVEAMSRPPKGPSKSSPPGPAHSPQTFTWLGYTQYFANLTEINNDFTKQAAISSDNPELVTDRWKKGKHHGKRPDDRRNPHPNDFRFQIEYDTRNDSTFGLKDLTVRSFVELAARIGKYKSVRVDRGHRLIFDKRVKTEEEERCAIDEATTEAREQHLVASKKKKKNHNKKKGRKHRKKGKRRVNNQAWFGFVKRAFVGARDEEDLHNEFGQVIDESIWTSRSDRSDMNGA